MLLFLTKLPPASPKYVSIFDIIFGGDWLNILFLIILFAIAIFLIYQFFKKYFSVERSNKEEPNLIEIIQDNIFEGRLESALDFCKTINTPETKIIEKGLLRFGKPMVDISRAAKEQEGLEINKIKKGLQVFDYLSKISIVFGFLGGTISLLYFLFNNSNLSTQPESFYTFLTPIVIGLLVGFIGFSAKLILYSLVQKTITHFKEKTNKFLEIINQNYQNQPS